MPLLNFKTRFVPFILTGAKTHTIRATRVRPTKPGDVLHLYTGLRHKGARLLFRAVCTHVNDIQIRQTRSGCFASLKDVEISIDGEILDPSEMELLAQRDGFASLVEMMRFWQEPKNRLPFHGQIINWKFPPLEADSEANPVETP